MVLYVHHCTRWRTKYKLGTLTNKQTKNDVVGVGGSFVFRMPRGFGDFYLFVCFILQMYVCPSNRDTAKVEIPGCSRHANFSSSPTSRKMAPRSVGLATTYKQVEVYLRATRKAWDNTLVGHGTKALNDDMDTIGPGPSSFLFSFHKFHEVKIMSSTKSFLFF